METKGPYRLSQMELARKGNARAIADWLNAFLSTYGVNVRIASIRPKYLQLRVESDKPLEPMPLIRMIGRRLSELNSDFIESIQVKAYQTGNIQPLWQKSLRITLPQSSQPEKKTRTPRASLKSWFTGRSQIQLIAIGAGLLAFVLGCLVGAYQPNSDPAKTRQASSNLSTETVQTALGPVPIRLVEAKSSATGVSLLFGGELNLANAFQDGISPDYSRAFAEMAEYREADLSMVDLKNPPLRQNILSVLDKVLKSKADPEPLQVLAHGGVDIVNLANTYGQEYGDSQTLKTLKTLNKLGIQAIGAGQTPEEIRRPLILALKGQRFAYLGYHQSASSSSSEKSIINLYQKEKMAEDIRALRKQVNWIIVNLHWGSTLEEKPSAQQQEIARFAIDQGADIVVGYQSNLFQGAEIYKDRPIFYSLGNLIFGGPAGGTYNTIISRVTLQDKKIQIQLLPVAVVKYQPKVITGERADDILAQVQQRSKGFKRPIKSSATLNLDAAASKASKPGEKPSANSFIIYPQERR